MPGLTGERPRGNRGRWMTEQSNIERRTVARQRLGILHQLENWLEPPLMILGLVWLVLLIVELTHGLTLAREALATVIWIIFILDFLLKLALAPNKLRYLRRNWFSALALAVPALRVFRIARALRVLRVTRAVRGLRLLRLLTSINRGMKVLGRTMRKRGFGYVVVLTIVITFAGGAGMYAFEKEAGALDSFGAALWWTAMIMTTMGSETWPQTAEGRLLCLLLALYAFTVFGYVTAVLATFFIERDAPRAEGGPDQGELAELRRELTRVTALLSELRAERGHRSRES